MNESYIIYKYFDGEASNPYDHDKQNAAHMFWGYERFFEGLFTSPDFLPDDWLPAKGLGHAALEWQRIIEKKPIDKEEFFKLWLFELLMVRLPDKMTSAGTDFNALYWNTTTISM